ncbi:trehalose operon repressor [Vaginisenegalia massiliensis]|uniref:trehalose operon repressor n=1 Tax=Vaginisenegalia massiliensis TaxID=2058294 RepID=UPI000F54325C|nr:trehalose operon repressor [Vaginisenegalia massiliensis]
MNKFEKIYLDIEKKIKDGIYPIGSLIPSEHDLASQYNVSRETIRKAQKILLENGFIQKKQGRGSVVLDYNRFSFPISGLVSYKELQEEQRINSITHLIQNRIVPAPEFLVGLEDVTPDEKFIHLVRTRVMNGEVMIIDEDYIRCSVVERIPDSIAKDSIYQYFEQQLNLSIGYATKEFIAEKASNMDIDLMNLNPMDYVIKVSSHVFLEDTTFFQYTTSHHRLEKFRFAEFARRKPRFN